MENESIEELIKSLRAFEKQARQIRKEIKRRFPDIESKYLALDFNPASPESIEQAGNEAVKWN